MIAFLNLNIFHYLTINIPKMSLLLKSLVSANVHTKIKAATTNNTSEIILALQHLRDKLRNKFDVNLDYK